MAADEKQVLRLHVEMLQRVAIAKKVEGVGRIAHVPEQLITSNSRQAGAATLVVTVFQTRVGQFCNDREPVVDDFDPFQREQERVADRLDAMKRAELQFRAAIIE